MISTLAPDDYRMIDEMPVPTSGGWAMDRPPRVTSWSAGGASILHTAGLAALLSVSACTAGHDPCADLQREFSRCSMVSAFEPMLPSRVTIGGARRIALAVLDAAENERRRFAEDEAAIAAFWEEPA